MNSNKKSSIKMSSASTSKFSVNKSGNYYSTARVNTPFCKVCCDAGLSISDYTNHYVKDQPGPNGKVVCPTLLAQKCLTCGEAGHTSSYCSQKSQVENERKKRDRIEYEQMKKASGGWETVGQRGIILKSKPRARIEDIDSSKSKKTSINEHHQSASFKNYGSFSALASEESSDESDVEYEEKICNTSVGFPKLVSKERSILSGPPPAIEPSKPLTWAQRAAAAAQKPVPCSTSTIADTRFQFHGLFDRVEQSNRAPKRMMIQTVTDFANSNETVLHRGAAAIVAAESSKKRKQNMATVPA